MEQIIRADPIIPDSYRITVTNYHLCYLVFGKQSAERVYRKRIAGLPGWIRRMRRSSHLTPSFIDICLELACESGEKMAKELYAKNPSLTSLEEWGIV
jgi:hypothetical protein